MLVLLELAQDFGRAFGTAKRELGVLDFHDLEQHGGTWIQRMLMVLGGALAAAWTTRMLVA